mmetsp:Transcript_30967/g.90879  ORF Transcript_30967/g.90879 Transcript_30967/m.90879 type:complete len:196 (+) Transcript_30967:170-757(+)
MISSRVAIFFASIFFGCPVTWAAAQKEPLATQEELSAFEAKARIVPPSGPRKNRSATQEELSAFEANARFVPPSGPRKNRSATQAKKPAAAKRTKSHVEAAQEALDTIRAQKQKLLSDETKAMATLTEAKDAEAAQQLAEAKQWLISISRSVRLSLGTSNMHTAACASSVAHPPQPTSVMLPPFTSNPSAAPASC